MGTLILGGTIQRLELRLTRDQDFVDTILAIAGDDHPTLPANTPIDWPDGTLCWLTVKNKGAQTSARWDLEVEGPYIHLDVDVTRVNAVTRDAQARLWLQYSVDVSDGKPFVWCAGPVSWHG